MLCFELSVVTFALRHASGDVCHLELKGLCRWQWSPSSAARLLSRVVCDS